MTIIMKKLDKWAESKTQIQFDAVMYFIIGTAGATLGLLIALLQILLG